MCGRYQRRSDKQRIAEAFQLGNLDEYFLELAPSYNVAPQSMQPVIVWDAESGMRTLEMMFWRFLPAFCADPKKFRLDTINAHADKLLGSRMWRTAFLEQRCLVPVDSFVEWRRGEGRTRIPFLFAMKDDEPFALGGIWRHWRAPDGKAEMNTFAIITTDPNELIVETTGHDRMPLIVRRADYQRWLEPGLKEQPPIDLLRPFDAEAMKAWRTDTRINNVRNNDPSLLDQVADVPVEKPSREEPPDEQMSMFGE